MGVTRYWRYSRERMQQLVEAGECCSDGTGQGRLAYKRYLDEMPGKPLQDLWTDINPIGAQARERLGYPTQKPRALLERIIAASSNEGDLVLDPFCGCGTTVDAALRLKRRWVGIDISAFAIDLVRDRRLKDPTIPTVGIPADLEGARKLAAEQPFAFESWAVTRLPGFAPNMQQRGDGGIDGRATLALAPDDLDSRLALAQVKGGKFSVSYLRDFRHVLDRETAALGLLRDAGSAAVEASWRREDRRPGACLRPAVRPPAPVVDGRVLRPAVAHASGDDGSVLRPPPRSAGVVLSPGGDDGGFDDEFRQLEALERGSRGAKRGRRPVLRQRRRGKGGANTPQGGGLRNIRYRTLVRPWRRIGRGTGGTVFRGSRGEPPKLPAHPATATASSVSATLGTAGGAEEPPKA